MMKKFLQMFVVLFLVSFATQAQTVSLDNVQADPGEVYVAMNMSGFDMNQPLGAITLYIEMDENMVDFTGHTNVNLGTQNDWIINFNEYTHILTATWTSFSGTSPIEGKILDLVFDYAGGSSTDLNFTSACEITTGLLQFDVTFVDGSISPISNDNNISIGSAEALVGEELSLPVTMNGAGFAQVDAFTYEISYNSNYLDFTGLDVNQLEGALLTASDNQIDGIITITWSSPLAADFSDMEIFKLNFTYNGGNSPIEFMGGTEISFEGNAIPYTPNNGMISLSGDATATLDIDEVVGYVGEFVEVPVMASDFGSNEMGAFTLKINYDNTRLDYDSTIPNQMLNWTISDDIASGLLQLQVSEAAGFNVNNGVLFTLKFEYIAEGTAPITFDATSSAALSNGTEFSLVLENGEVTQGGILTNTTTGGNWDDASSWDLGVVPNGHHNVVVNEGSELIINPLVEAITNGIIINENGQVTNNGQIAITEDLVIISNENGNGSFINNGTVVIQGNVTAQMYATAGQWHGIAPSVADQIANDLYLEGNPDVWIKEYNETTAAYEPTQWNVNTPLGDMKGWMTWVGGTTPHTFNFTGTLRQGTVVPTIALTRTDDDTNAGYGKNLVGNPFTSAIDWDASNGWTKENIANSVHVYNNGIFASYVNGVGNNDGSQYIAMNQAFFVEVLEGETNGVLKADNQVQVHNDVPFMKSNNDLLRLRAIDGDLADELTVVINSNSTNNYDAQYDAGKMFGLDQNHPQIYAYTADARQVAINAIPATTNVMVDLKAVDGHLITIEAIETESFDEVTLIDNLENVSVDIKNNKYDFVYDANVTERFEIKFGPISNQSNLEIDFVNVYALNHTIFVQSLNNKSIDVTVFNLLGQVITTESTMESTSINVDQNGTYLVKVTDGLNTEVKKLVVK